MSRLPRKEVFDPTEVGIYHCINRCVRRSFLCGFDALTGRSYEHRKQWLQDRMAFLAGVFACDFLGFSIMSNHFHLVVRNRPDLVANWDDLEVARRWYRLCPVRANAAGQPMEPTEADLGMIVNNTHRVAELRKRLSNPSWMMRFLTEKIARVANAEDKVSGRFWEGRFRMQKLLDESAVAACTVYVDLNPIRAGVAPTPETSQFTSVYERIQATIEACRETPPEGWRPDAPAVQSVDLAVQAPAESSVVPAETSLRDCANTPAANIAAPIGESKIDESTTGSGSDAARIPVCASSPRAAWLSPLEISVEIERQPVPLERASNKGCVAMSFAAYLELLEWTGRQWRSDKRGAIDEAQPPILERLGLAGESWLKLLRGFRGSFRRAAGKPAAMEQEADRRGRRWIQGIAASRAAFEARSTAAQPGKS